MGEIMFPTSIFTCAHCGKPLEPSKNNDGLKQNEVRCVHCNSINSIFAAGGGGSHNYKE